LLFSGVIFSPVFRFFFWLLVSDFLLLTWLGRCPAESPYIEVALFCTFLYFFLILFHICQSHFITFMYKK
jgi:quinol-cytochrome oxidoreductase complex cytochrome b subunit